MITERLKRWTAEAGRRAACFGLLNWAVLLCFFLVQLFLLLHHEAWRDEAQAWTIGRNFSLPEIVRDLSNEGHPILWFLVIKAVTVLGLPYKYFGAVSLLFVCAAAFFLLWKSPFPLPLNCCVLAASLFTYYNPVIARSYSAALLIIVLLAAAYGERECRPIVFGILTALLFQTHVHLAGLALGLTAVTFFRLFGKTDRKKWLAAFGIECLSLLFLVLTLRQGGGTPTAHPIDLQEFFYYLGFKSLKEGVRIFESQVWPLTFLDERSFAVFLKCISAALLLLAAAAAAVLIRRKAWKTLLETVIIAGAALGEYTVVVALIYGPHKQMATCFLMIILFLTWTLYAEAEKKPDGRLMRILTGTVLALCCVFTYPSVYQSAAEDVREVYSGSKDTAAFLIRQTAPDSVILMDYEGAQRAVYAYAADERKDLIWWEIDSWAPFRVHVWNREPAWVPEGLPEVSRRIREEFPGTEHIYYLSAKKRTEEGLTLLYAMEEKNVKFENFWLYELQEGSPRTDE